MPSTTSRRFGVEFEVTAPVTRERMADMLTRAGLDARVASYSGQSYNIWQVKMDGSLTAGRGQYPMEIVSPILDWADTAEVTRQFTALASVFQQAGVTVNRSCGGHVHIQVDDLTGPQIAALVRMYARRSRIVDDLAGRGTNQWAYPVAPQMGDRWSEAIERGDTTFVSSSTGRYVTINPTHYARRGTFEFRQGAGRDRAETMLGWVGFLMALIEAARTDANVRVPNGADVETHLARLVEADLLAPHLAQWVRGDLSESDLLATSRAAEAEAMATIRQSLSTLLTLQGM